jgi:hypothetical protein
MPLGRSRASASKSPSITQKQVLIVGSRSLLDNPGDGPTLAKQLEQTNTLLQDLGSSLRPTSPTWHTRV